MDIHIPSQLLQFASIFFLASSIFLGLLAQKMKAKSTILSRHLKDLEESSKRLHLRNDELESELSECRSMSQENLTKYTQIRDKYSTVVNIDEKAREVEAKWHDKIHHLKNTAKDISEEWKEKIYALKDQARLEEIHISDLRKQFQEKKSIYQRLEKEIRLFEDDIEAMSFGVYKPRFDLADSEKYKQKIKANKDKQKKFIKNEKACICTSEWTVEGSVEEGKKMTKRQIKLMLYAFNGECDSLIAKVKWNNAEKSAERINKTFAAINKLGETNATHITSDYLKLKLEELYLTYENEVKKYEEREEQKRIAAEMREEARAEKEYQKAIKRAEEEERKYQEAYAKAKSDLDQASDQERKKYELKLQQLRNLLDEASLNKERAISQAQLTKSGYIYIISNIGSFGEGVYKIGMTRRLEPMDRVKELGDASVPFSFDVHAMIYSENAPELERQLHSYFEDKRVNLSNNRKEFFEVSLKDIQYALGALQVDAQVISSAEAKEFRESQAMRQEEETKSSQTSRFEDKFPASI